jgi:hypothetical protein
MNREVIVGSFSGLFLLACSDAVPLGRRCPTHDRVCSSGDAAASGGDAPGSDNPQSEADGGSRIGTLSIEVVRLACTGDCADIEVLARGGNPPYVYRWGDGSMSARRRVCSQGDGALTIEVTDTAPATTEIGALGQTKTASVRADELGCPAADAGEALVDGGPDASLGSEDAGRSGMCMLDGSVPRASDCQERDPFDCSNLTPSHLSYALGARLSPGRVLCLRLSDFGVLSPVTIAISGGTAACTPTEGLVPGSVTLSPEQLLAPGSVVCLQTTSGTVSHLTVELLGGASGDLSRIKFEECADCGTPL